MCRLVKSSVVLLSGAAGVPRCRAAPGRRVVLAVAVGETARAVLWLVAHQLSNLVGVLLRYLVCVSDM